MLWSAHWALPPTNYKLVKKKGEVHFEKDENHGLNDKNHGINDENNSVNDEDDDLDVDGGDENHDDDGDDDVNGDDDNVAAHLWVWAFNSSKARVKGPWILLNALPSARDDDDSR